MPQLLFSPDASCMIKAAIIKTQVMRSIVFGWSFKWSHIKPMNISFKYSYSSYRNVFRFTTILKTPYVAINTILSPDVSCKKIIKKQHAFHSLEVRQCHLLEIFSRWTVVIGAHMVAAYHAICSLKVLRPGPNICAPFIIALQTSM